MCSKQIAPLLIATVFISGCATWRHREHLPKTWVGRSESELVASWGRPTGRHESKDGGSTLLYSTSRTVETGGVLYTVPSTKPRLPGSSKVTDFVTKTTPRQSIKLSCETTFEVDGQGIVRSWQSRGNECAA